MAEAQRQLLSIVIVSYNVRELLEACLRSLPMGGVEEPEVWVVDNASTDGSVEMVRHLFPTVNLIVNQDNAGFPKGNNQAIGRCSGKFILLLNPDTVVKQDAFKILISYLEDHPEAGLVGPKLLNADGSHQYSVMPFLRPLEIILETFFLHDWYRSKRDHRMQGDQAPRPVDALSGAAILVRREVFDRIGLLDEQLFWTEDMEFCLRAHQARIGVAYMPEAEIVHHSGASGKKNQRVMVSNQVLSKIRYFSRNHPALVFWTCWFFRLLHIISRLLILLPLSIFALRYREKLDAYAFTLKRFIRGDY